jgi:hypothetical protein
MLLQHGTQSAARAAACGAGEYSNARRLCCSLRACWCWQRDKYAGDCADERPSIHH